MKKNILISLLIVAFGLAFAAGPVEGPPGIQDVLSISFGELFGTAAALAGALNLVGAALRHWLKMQGLLLFSFILGIGALVGAGGQIAGLLTVLEFTTLPVPLGGILFGIQAGSLAVTANQAKRLTVGQSPAKQEPNPTSPNSNLPRSG